MVKKGIKQKNFPLNLEDSLVIIASIVASVFVANTYKENNNLYGLIGLSVMSFIFSYTIFRLAFIALEFVFALIYPLIRPINYFSEILDKMDYTKIIKHIENFWRNQRCLNILIIIGLSILFFVYIWHALNWINRIFILSLDFYLIIYHIFRKN